MKNGEVICSNLLCEQKFEFIYKFSGTIPRSEYKAPEKIVWSTTTYVPPVGVYELGDSL
jgi:hypothetical protein